MLRSFFIIFTALTTGNFLSDFLSLPLPGSVISLILLTLLLELKIITPSYIEEGSKILIDNMSLFFIPAGVGLIQNTGILSQDIVPIVLSCVISTFAVMLTVSYSYRFLAGRK